MAAPGLLVLWDVDLTLLNAGGMSPQLYAAVFAELFGRELTEVAPMAGRTDRAIITETLTMAGIPDPREHVAAFMAAMTRQAPAYGELVRRRGHVLPGAVAALTALAELAAAGGTNGTGPVHQSVLTGNIRPLAEVKLGAFGLSGFLELDIGAYGETHEARSELVHVARERARAATGTGTGDGEGDGTGEGFAGGEGLAGGGFAGELTVLIGDTPLDVAAALATGARAVGVASGGYTETDLAGAGAHVVLPDLADTPRVLAAILAGQAPPQAGQAPPQAGQAPPQAGQQ
jgi:phosphoglycolate phosphatase